MSKFIITEKSITYIDGDKNYVCTEDDKNWQVAQKHAYAGNWTKFKVACDTKESLVNIRRLLGKDFELTGHTIRHRGTDLGEKLTRLICDPAAQNAGATANFIKRLVRNPSALSRANLYDFLERNGMRITEDGRFVAYKGVTEKFLDHQTKTFSNLPGTINEMPREGVDPDPNTSCSTGFHVGSYRYAKNFAGSGGRVVDVIVDPADAVAVPVNEADKLRVCRYEVLCEHGQENRAESTVVPARSLSVFLLRNRKPEKFHVVADTVGNAKSIAVTCKKAKSVDNVELVSKVTDLSKMPKAVRTAVAKGVCGLVVNTGKNYKIVRPVVRPDRRLAS